jgi:uncharacterized membrane protein
MIDSNATDTRQTLTILIEQKQLSKQNVPDAIALADISPSVNQWQSFISTMLFWSGSIALAFSLIFFIAANWQDIGRMAKFALVEVAIVLAMFAYVKFSHNTTIRQASLLLCMLFVGGLMALFGQTYQTGADPWQLFFNWAMVTIPWVLISRFSVMWLIWLALLNLSMSLFYQTFGGYLDNTWALFLLNSFALVVWQTNTGRFSFLDKPWAINLLGVVSGYFGMWVYLVALFDDKPVGILMWCIWAAVMFYVYRVRSLNVFMLAGWSLSILVAANALLMRILTDVFDVFSFLLLTCLTVGAGTYLTVWLKGLLKEARS